MCITQREISKVVMPLNKSIRLALHEFIRKASPSRQCCVIPEMCMTHSGTDRPRGQKKCATEARGLRASTRPSTELKHKPRSDCGIGKGSGRGNRQLEF